MINDADIEMIKLCHCRVLINTVVVRPVLCVAIVL